LLPLLDPNNPPTCNIVIQKQGEEEKICNQPASQMVSLVDPDDQSHVIAVVLLCDKHDKDLESGASLIAVSDDGKERIAVQYKNPKGG